MFRPHTLTNRSRSRSVSQTTRSRVATHKAQVFSAKRRQKTGKKAIGDRSNRVVAPGSREIAPPLPKGGASAFSGGGVAFGDAVGEPTINFLFGPRGRSFAQMNRARKFTGINFSIDVLTRPGNSLAFLQLGE
jgi:hypothetical protein